MINLFRMDSEITNNCNAACPLCPRTGKDGKESDIVNRQGITDLSLDYIDKIMASKAGMNIRKWTYCGNYGDPLMHKQALEFAQTLADYNVKFQNFDSNGGMRGTKWWEELGRVPGVTVNFALDGLEDTNHIYRVKTNFNKIIANAEAFMKAGGNATWTMLIFSHNQHQIEEAKELSKKLGFSAFYTKKSSRQVIVKEDKKPAKVKDVDYKFQLSKKTEQKSTISQPSNEKFRAPAAVEGVKQHRVICGAIKKQQLYITPDAKILPCCHVHTGVYESLYGITDQRKQFLDFLLDNNVKYDLALHGFDDIVASYRENIKVLDKHWTDRTIPVCNRKCGSNLANLIEEVK